MLASRNSAESPGDPLMVMKLGLIVSGIYIWEFITTLDFEWSVIRRRQRYQWTIWIYSISRLSGLTVIIFLLVNFYGTSPINCQAWISSGWAFSAIGYCLSSMLIILRIYAIWDKSKVIMAISAAIWVINLGFQLSGIIKVRAEWVPEARSCAITNIEHCRDFVVSTLVTDVILLSIMLVGLLRLRRGAAGYFYLSRLLWKQGVIWLAVATAAQLPQVVLLFLNVNDSIHALFLAPSMITIIIAATRTYRSLIHSASSSGLQFSQPDSHKTKHLVSHTTAVHIPSNRLGVTVHSAYNPEHPMSQTNHYDSYPSSDAQLTDKPLELVSDDNVVGRQESRDERK